MTSSRRSRRRRRRSETSDSTALATSGCHGNVETESAKKTLANAESVDVPENKQNYSGRSGQIVEDRGDSCGTGNVTNSSR